MTTTDNMFELVKEYAAEIKILKEKVERYEEALKEISMCSNNYCNCDCCLAEVHVIANESLEQE